jgi:hypothetical protein
VDDAETAELRALFDDLVRVVVVGRPDMGLVAEDLEPEAASDWILAARMFSGMLSIAEDQDSVSLGSSRIDRVLAASAVMAVWNGVGAGFSEAELILRSQLGRASETDHWMPVGCPPGRWVVAVVFAAGLALALRHWPQD